MNTLLAAIAVAPLVTGPGTIYFAGMPPERFQGAATVELMVVAPEALELACDMSPPDGLTLKGCARTNAKGQPYIIIPDPCRLGEVEETARILCHELSHVNGWPGDHPL